MEPGFRREVDLLGLMFVSLGSIIGSGWLLGGLTAATSAGGGSIISWLVAGVIIILLALVHAELGAAYPFAGGSARWSKLAFGHLGGFTAAWVAWLQAVTIAPIEVEVALSYLDHQWHDLINDVGQLTPKGLVVATGLMALFTMINALGVRWLTESNRIAVLWKTAVPILTVAVLFVVSFHPGNFTAGGGFTSFGAHGVLAALPLGVVFALQGFEQAVQIGSEARDAQRDVPRAVIGAVIVGTLLYLALEVAFIGALNPGDLAHGWTNPVGEGKFRPYAALATNLNLGWLATILYVNAFISPASTGLIYLGTSARLAYAMGKTGYLPKRTTQIRNRGVPYISILLAFVVGLICFLPFPSWHSLISLATSAAVIMYAFAPITLLALRKTRPDRERPYRLPAADFLARLAFIAANEVIYWTSWTTVRTLMLLIVGGYLLFGIFYALGRLDDRSPQNPRALVWIIPWLAGLTVISYLGQYDGLEVIPQWADMGVVAGFSLLICHLALRHGLPATGQPHRKKTLHNVC